jgi:hypothetical protein
MSRRITCLAAIAGFLLLTPLGHAQTAPYTEGSVWAMTLIRIVPGHGDDFYNDLRASTKRQLDEAKRQGLVLSYKIISTNATTPSDWNGVLMIEYKNMAALDGLRAKMDPIATQTIGSEEQRRDRALKRNEIREVIGTKLGRELILRDSVAPRASK